MLEIIYQLVPSILCGNSILLKDNPDTPVVSKHLERALADSAPGLAQHFHINPMNAINLYENKDV